MWNWDQGRLEYFQFDNLKKIARFALTNDLRLTEHAPIIEYTGLPFLPYDEQYKPWRNYRRVFGLSMICIEQNQGSAPTPIAHLLASDGGITTDEYFHFLAQATSDPSPVLTGWNHAIPLRYPLLFSLKFLLARCAVGNPIVEIADIIAAYHVSNFYGHESQDDFVNIISNDNTIAANEREESKVRQSRESIRVLAQISYLSLDSRNITVSLSPEDATDMFEQLNAIQGDPLPNGSDEILRLTNLFEPMAADLDLSYPDTTVSDIEDSGFSSKTTFAEGSKTRKTHIVTERNSKLRAAFFRANPTAVCDFCKMDTAATYPWTKRILDIHHLLPLCSGTRTSNQGTVMDDLVAVCPTCHRGVHRYYDKWLKRSGQKDFADVQQAREVYKNAKRDFEAA